MPSHADVHMLPVDDMTPEQCAELQNFAYWKRVHRACDAELASAGFVAVPLREVLRKIVATEDNSLTPRIRKLSDQYMSDQFDWAMNIRQATEYDWATCLQLAEVFLYG